MNTHSFESKIEPVDYMSFYPRAQQYERGGDYKYELFHEDMKEMSRFCMDSSRLLTGETDSQTVFYQADAYSTQGEAVRDELVDILGTYTGFDVDGELTKNEVHGNLVISEADMKALSIDDGFKDVPLSVVYRSIQFGTVASETSVQITEIEIPTADVIENEDGTTRNRTLRILSAVRLVEQET